MILLSGIRRPIPDTPPSVDAGVRGHGCEFCGDLPAFWHKGHLVCLRHEGHVR